MTTNTNLEPDGWTDAQAEQTGAQGIVGNINPALCTDTH